MNKQKLIFRTLMSILLLVISCSKTPDIAGATSETTNGFITATVVNHNGYIEKRAKVFLRESIVDGGAELQVTSTNDEGVFRFDSLEESSYCIEVVSTSGYRGKHNFDEKQGLDTVMVSVPGSIVGQVAPSSGILSLSLLGLDRELTSIATGSADTVGRIFIDSVPAGEILLLATDMLGDTVFYETVIVESEQETDIGIIDTRVAFKKDSLIVQNILSFATDQSREFNTLVEQRNGRIVELFLDSVGLTSLSPEVVKLPLEKLSIPGNNLTELPDFIGDFPELEYLDISKNNLTELSLAITKLKRCSNIDMGNNKLADLPDELFAMKSLMMLYVNENYLNNLPENKVAKIDKLSIDNKWQERQQ